MVGVPGRSKGCKRCRDRKVKCDETRPGCTRCAKIGKECPGYVRPVYFIYTQQYNPTASESDQTVTEVNSSGTLIYKDASQIRLNNGNQSVPTITTTDTSKPPSPSENITPISTSSNGSSISALQRRKVQSAVTKRQALVQTPISRAQAQIVPQYSTFQNTIIDAQQMQSVPASIPVARSEVYAKVFIQDFIHVSSPYKSSFRSSLIPYRFGHMYALQFRSTTDDPSTIKLLEDGHNSTAATYYSIKTGDMTARIQGRMLYLKLLQRLRQDVKDGLSRCDTGVFLYTAMMAAHYEVLTSMSASTWLCHVGAMGRLIESRGPLAFREDFAGAIFEIVRPYIIFECIISTRPCFLEKEEWRTIPFLDASGPRSNEWNRLIDLATQIPGILKSGKDLMQDFTRETATKHVQKILSIVQPLLIWRSGWNRTLGREPHTYPVPTSIIADLHSSDEQGPLFDSVLFYQNISICTTIQYYDTVICVVANHIKKLLPWFDSYFGPQDELCLSLRQTYASIDPEMIAREIARSVDYQRLPEYKNGSTGVFFGAKAAFDVVGKDARIGRVLERVVITSPLLLRTGQKNTADLLNVWYGPEPPNENDFLDIHARRTANLSFGMVTGLTIEERNRSLNTGYGGHQTLPVLPHYDGDFERLLNFD